MSKTKQTEDMFENLKNKEEKANYGYISQITGAVVDVKFDDIENLPNTIQALKEGLEYLKSCE